MLTQVDPPSIYIILPNPQQNDEENYDPAIKVRQTRGEETLIGKIVDQLTITSFTYSFTITQPDLYDDLLNFLLSTVGQELDIVDHHGDNYHGFITTNPLEIVTRRDQNIWTIQLTIEKKI